MCLGWLISTIHYSWDIKPLVRSTLLLRRVLDTPASLLGCRKLTYAKMKWGWFSKFDWRAKCYSGKLRHGPPNDSVKKWWGVVYLWGRKQYKDETLPDTYMCGFCQLGWCSIMQMLSRDSTRSENNKKSLNKNGNTFCCEWLNRTGLGRFLKQASTRLCLAFLEFFTVLENKRLFQLDPVLQRNCIPS